MAERSSENIQRDIERTRADMSETIDALERRLSPGELFDEFWGRMKGGQTGANLGDTIRDHPVPLALMGLGLGWLAIEKATGSHADQLRSRHGHGVEGTYARAEGRVGPYRGDEVIDPDQRYGSTDGPGSRIGEAADAVKDRVTGVGDEVKDRLSSASESAREGISGVGDRLRGPSDGPGSQGDGGGSGLSGRAHHLRETADEEMRHAREAMHRRGGQLERGIRSLLQDYPLALGAVTFGLGLAAGAGAPTTRTEDRLMGDAADALKTDLKDTAREAAEHAREIAGEAAQAARTEARKEGIGDDLKARAERVAHAASSTAREEAESKGFTTEAMKERARETGEKIAAHAREGAGNPPTGTGSRASRPSGPAITPPSSPSTGSSTGSPSSRAFGSSNDSLSSNPSPSNPSPSNPSPSNPSPAKPFSSDPGGGPSTDRTDDRLDSR